MSNEEVKRSKIYDFVNAYEFTCELPGSEEEIKFKPVTTFQLKQLLTYENENNLIIQEQALDDLISSSVLNEDFNIDEMYIDDKMFLLVELRKKSKGEFLEFQLECPKCNSQSINKINLDELDIIPFNPNINRVVKLSNGVKVYVRNLKRKHQKEIKPNMIKKNWSETKQLAELQSLHLACAIDKIELPDKTIEENIKIMDKVYLVDNIPTNEKEKIEEKLEEISFGVDFNYKVKCIHCKYEHETSIPLKNNFFS